MSALALLYMLATPFLAKYYSAKGRYYAWLIIMVGLIIPFRPQWGNVLFSIQVPTSTPPVVQINNEMSSHFTPPITLPILNQSPIDNIVTSGTTLNISWWQIGFAVWLVGVVAFITYHGIKHYYFSKKVRRWSVDITDRNIFALLENITTEMGIKRQIQIYQCALVGSPMMIGLFKPRMLLPTVEVAQEELYFILKHELVHYKRKDLMYKFLALVVTALHWFNPFVHLMTKAVNVLCETSCDAEVLQGTDMRTRRSYGETIIGVVQYKSKLKTALSTNFYGGKKGMKNRISSIMDINKKRAGTLILCSLLVLTLATSVVVAASASDTTSQAPEAIMESTTIINNTNDGTAMSVDGGQTWQAHDTNVDFDFNIEAMTVAELENQLAELRDSAGALVAYGYYTWEEINKVIALMEEQLTQVREGNLTIIRPFDFDGNTASIAISLSPQTGDDVLIVNEVFQANTFIVSDGSDFMSRPSTALLFAEYEAWGLTFEGLYSNPNGGFTANPRQNVFFNGQLVRGFSDFDNEVGMSISSVDRGGDIWIHVIRDANGNIVGLDTK